MPGGASHAHCPTPHGGRVSGDTSPIMARVKSNQDGAPPTRSTQSTVALSDGPNAAALFEAANKLRGSVESAEYKHLAELLDHRGLADAARPLDGLLEWP
jgi:hypothetical protein